MFINSPNATVLCTDASGHGKEVHRIFQSSPKGTVDKAGWLARWSHNNSMHFATIPCTNTEVYLYGTDPKNLMVNNVYPKKRGFKRRSLGRCP
eukprot:4451145-Pyramimonas_sp.AAC.1